MRWEFERLWYVDFRPPSWFDEEEDEEEKKDEEDEI